MANKKNLNDLDQFSKLAREHGMTYGQLQVMETLKEVKVVEGVLLKKNKEGYYEPY